jgi:hypothetical protein
MMAPNFGFGNSGLSQRCEAAQESVSIAMAPAITWYACTNTPDSISKSRLHAGSICSTAPPSARKQQQQQQLGPSHFHLHAIARTSARTSIHRRPSACSRRYMYF